MRAQERESQFAAALAQHRDALYRICCGYVGDDADRQDIYQEVLINLWKNLDTFRGESKLGTWLYRVAVNTCLGWLRREKRRSQMLMRAGQEQEVMSAGQGEETGRFVRDEVQQLYACITRLAPVDRLLVSLYLEEMPSAEMASVLGISEGNIRVKLHRIRNQLRRMWED